MKRLFLLSVLAVGACGSQADQQETPSAPINPDVLQSPGPVSKPPPVVPLPTDKAELDRMILAGYTPHADHLHSPGVNECPLTKGNEAVM